MKIILEKEDFDYMNRIRDSEKMIMQKGSHKRVNNPNYEFSL